MSISNPSAWVSNPIQSLSIPAHPLQGAFGLVWFVDDSSLPPHNTNALSSSAKDQLTGASVAIKKIMKPFSTPVLSKRTYRELKLLKHIQHENVCLPCPPRLLYFPRTNPPSHQIISLSDVFISPLEDMWVSHTLYTPPCPCPPLIAPFGQLFRDRAPRHRSSPTAYITTVGKAVHSVLLVPNSGQPYLFPPDSPVLIFTIQRGLKYVHSAGVVHRDLVSTQN